MTKWINQIDDTVGVGATTVADMKANGPTYGVGLSTNFEVCNINSSGISTFTGKVTIGSTGGVSGSGREYEGGIGFGTIGDSGWIHAKFQLPQYAGIASAPLEPGSLFYNTSTGDICYYNEAASRFEKITSTAA